MELVLRMGLSLGLTVILLEDLAELVGRVHRQLHAHIVDGVLEERLAHLVRVRVRVRGVGVRGRGRVGATRARPGPSP